MTARKIIHLDLDAFFCAVEELRDPQLKGRPFAVGGAPNQRGVVASCSYAARQFGVHSAMPTSQALRLCPNLILVHSSHGVYGEASAKVMEILGSYTPLVEQISIDEAFLDVSDLPQSGLEIGRELQARINRELNLPCSLGIASNKLVAKMATNAAKAGHHQPTPPNAILVVPAGEEAQFLAGLPVRELWGVGPRTAERMAQMGIRTLGQLAAVPQKTLESRFGRMGTELALHARGVDERPVVVEHDVKSISQEVTFERDLSDGEALRQTLYALAEQVGYRLRRKELCAETVRIKLRWSDFSTLTRQVTLEQPADQDGVIYQAALELFERVWQTGKPVRLLGVGVSSLCGRAYQLSLWETPSDKERRLLGAVDQLRERYGRKVVQRGNTLKSDRNQKQD